MDPPSRHIIDPAASRLISLERAAKTTASRPAAPAEIVGRELKVASAGQGV